MKLIMLLLIAAGACASSAAEHLVRADDLFKEDPSKAERVLRELDLELRDHPDNIEALLFKAMMQMRVNAPEAALKTLNEAIQADKKAQTLHPEIYYVHACCLCQ